MIVYFAHTEPGGHEESQDRFEVRSVPGSSPCYVCAVADGQGGQSGAALAAATACQGCLETAFSYPQDRLLSVTLWPTILQVADEAVADAKDAGFTTLLAFCLTEYAVCGSSSGDGAVLLLNANQRPCILTKHQVKNPPVGSRRAEFVPFASPLVHPWTLLAMTDGVWKYAGWESVIAAAAEGDGETIIHKLREKAVLQRTNRLQDDFTVVVFQA